jgi:hypothetical protein
MPLRDEWGTIIQDPNVPLLNAASTIITLPDGGITAIPINITTPDGYIIYPAASYSPEQLAMEAEALGMDPWALRQQHIDSGLYEGVSDSLVYVGGPNGIPPTPGRQAGSAGWWQSENGWFATEEEANRYYTKLNQQRKKGYQGGGKHG